MASACSSSPAGLAQWLLGNARLAPLAAGQTGCQRRPLDGRSSQPVAAWTEERGGAERGVVSSLDAKRPVGCGGKGHGCWPLGTLRMSWQGTRQLAPGAPGRLVMRAWRRARRCRAVVKAPVANLRRQNFKLEVSSLESSSTTAHQKRRPDRGAVTATRAHCCAGRACSSRAEG